MDRKNKVMLAAAIGAVAILVASSAVRCAVTRTVEVTVPNTAVATQEAPEAEPDGEGAEMDATAKKALEALRSHAWQAEGDAKKTVAFRDGSLVESGPEGVKVTAFEVTGAHEDDDHASLDVTMTREGSGSFSSVIAIDGREDSLAVSCDGFANASCYVQGSGAEGPVEVGGLAEPYTSLIDGKADALASAITDYCRDRVPTATKATFDGEVYLDVAGGRVTATFHCDDKASTILSVAYAGGAFTVSG